MSSLMSVGLSHPLNVAGLLPDANFDVRIRSENGSGISPYSEVLTVTTDSPWVAPVWGGGGAGTGSSGDAGSPVAGDVLTISSLDCSGYPALSFGYEWQVFDGASWAPAGGEATFTVPETALSGQRWRCVVTATNAKGSAACTSNETGGFVGGEMI